MTFATLSGKRIVFARIVVGNIGPWFAEVELEGDDTVSGAVTLSINGRDFLGTIDASQNGAFAGSRKLRLVGGGGGWSNVVAAKGYHNDAQVKASTVADDVARSVGETIGGFVPAVERIGIDYAREAGLASRVLEDVIGGVPWWVGYDGVTVVGARPLLTAVPDAYEVLAYDPADRRAELGVTDVAAITIGTAISKSLEGAQTVRELEIIVDSDELRVTAWCGGTATGAGHLAGIMRSIVDRATDGKLLGKWRYRVVRMSVDRVECQAVRKGAGLPDLLPVSMWPGVAGVHAELTPGAEVLIEFIEGDRTMPIITHFAGKGGVGHVPVSLVLCGGTQAVARQGDLVQSGGVGTMMTLTNIPPNVSPYVLPGLPYLVSFDGVAPTPVLAAPLYGAISTGSPKVKA